MIVGQSNNRAKVADLKLSATRPPLESSVAVGELPEDTIDELVTRLWGKFELEGRGVTPVSVAEGFLIPIELEATGSRPVK